MQKNTPQDAGRFSLKKRCRARGAVPHEAGRGGAAPVGGGAAQKAPSPEGRGLGVGRFRIIPLFAFCFCTFWNERTGYPSCTA